MADSTGGPSLFTAREARAAIERERETRHWPIDRWSQEYGDHWPRHAGQTQRDADAAADWFMAALDQLRSVWNAHFRDCPQPNLNLPMPTADEIRAWMDAPSDTASA